MSFLLNCPNCGDRNVNEFHFGGEVTSRPAPDDSPDVWSGYFLFSQQRRRSISRMVEPPLSAAANGS